LDAVERAGWGPREEGVRRVREVRFPAERKGWKREKRGRGGRGGRRASFRGIQGRGERGTELWNRIGLVQLGLCAGTGFWCTHRETG
jgi:hypothetical protein